MMKLNNWKKLAGAALLAVGIMTVANVQHAEAAVTDPITVKNGQTLSELAAQYGTNVQAWKYTNNLQSEKVQAGQKLYVAFPYKVTAGDQISYLANRYKTTVGDIKKLNQLKHDKLTAGQTIVIPVGTKGEAKKAVAATPAPAKTAPAPVKAAPAPVKAAPAPAKAAPAPVKAAPAPVKAAPAPVAAPKAPAQPTIAGMTYSKSLNMTASAYGPGNIMWQWGGFTKSGTKVREGVIAVDPKVIPLGTKVYVTGYNSPLLPAGGFVAVAEDTGGKILGNRIDIFIDGTQAELRQFGMQDVKLYVLK